jgi:hypothetical protein
MEPNLAESIYIRYKQAEEKQEKYQEYKRILSPSDDFSTFIMLYIR